ncbi:SDR family oxidoreductase [Rhodococcus oxybenzonivorans]|jgi:3alpha(or 20beta)-hydroxysteroid dehydrogenase|uniref:SDR family oxidoreductase n=2 Tax=Nocardiaceae TaxID=85025 RepID=A0AAE4UVV2_9NOCA|nr:MULTISPECIES: SDR family oxidoreductase [Rhodococcus]MDV7243407.1 SDR family oxidoreductase [Rhodococcus oxybenzonivorans]MDV7263893.1 SDR family oxidoreductase [Rhodococcus oxybenzonivorans]MDV7276833.1 SDR family oxidoreductase [Rhodococcus oxybenzonivorans]MDV7334333.1 SDR family oxidoreductase [Rhodococcus oxybenzonivorans]MDV7344488.1 SDR family oxidoreductase [Rhodococcus oxybenzonivorans]
MDTRLRDKVVLVTGATGGIGIEIVARLADEGAHVVATDVDAQACEKLVSAQEQPDRHQGLALDITQESQWQSVVEAVSARYGRLDTVVNNGAIGSLETVVDEDLDRYNRVIAVSQTGTWLGMKHAGNLIERTGGGSVVNICSILGTVGGLGNSFAYAAAKGAVRTMTKNAALHWATKGVRVNSVHPGFIETEQLLERFEGTERHRAMVAHTPMGRLGRASEVAAMVAFLASDDSTFVTGSELYVDGGWTAD